MRLVHVLQTGEHYQHFYYEVIKVPYGQKFLAKIHYPLERMKFEGQEVHLC